jgi:hypothetical protein
VKDGEECVLWRDCLLRKTKQSKTEQNTTK